MSHSLSAARAVALAAALALPSLALAANDRDYEDPGAVALAVDTDVVIPLPAYSPFSDPQVSLGIAGRLGWRAKAGPLFAQPEAVFGIQQIASHDEAITLVRGMGGARLGMRGLIQPQAAAHLGYAGSGGPSGLAYDLVLALGLHIPPACVGVHVSYNGVVDSAAPTRWVDVGPDITFLF